MPIDKWEDDQIESMLRDFPAIRDERPKEEIYNKLVQTGQPVKKQPKRWVPMLVAAMAFLTLGVLAASFLGQNNFDTAGDSGNSPESESAVTAVQEDAEDNSTADTDNSANSVEESESVEESDEAFTAMAPDYRTAVYAEDLENYQLFTVGLTENAFVIPVSFLIPAEQVQADLGLENPDSLDLYNEYAADVDEAALGFDEYHPYAGTLGSSGNAVEHRLPDAHEYDIASAAIEVYTWSLRTTFWDFEEILVLDEKGGPIEFDQVGPMDPLPAATENIAYYAYNSGGENTYLVPSYGMRFETVSDAVSEMSTAPNDFYQPAIPDAALYEVSETDEFVIIDFNEPYDFNGQVPEEAIRMIESIALTAESFGKQVQFLNTSESNWNGFDFTQPITPPVAANRMNWD